MDGIRLRLARADDAGRRAWSEAAEIARRVVNSRAAGLTDDEALRSMAERLERVRIALDEMAQVEELLSRAVRGGRRRLVRTYVEDAPCVTCLRSDALVNVLVCARCSELGPYAGVRWSTFSDGVARR